MTLSKTLDRSELISRAVWEAAFSSRFHEPTQLTMLTIWYLELLIEHQSAITLLIRQHHAGSAMALVRSTFEILCRGMWAISHMAEADAKKVLDDTFKFPTMAVMVSNIDVAYATDGTFAQLKQENWDIFNNFTHSGNLQFLRRINGSSIENNYPEAELKVAVNASLIYACILAISFLKMLGRTAEAASVEAIVDSLNKP